MLLFFTLIYIIYWYLDITKYPLRDHIFSISLVYKICWTYFQKCEDDKKLECTFNVKTPSLHRIVCKDETITFRVHHLNNVLLLMSIIPNGKYESKLAPNEHVQAITTTFVYYSRLNSSTLKTHCLVLVCSRNWF